MRRIECDGDVCRMVVDEQIESGKKLVLPNIGWTIYGASWCGFCRRACQLLDTMRMEYQYYDVDELSDNAKQQLVNMTNGYTSIPKIFYNYQFIGGLTELQDVFD